MYFDLFFSPKTNEFPPSHINFSLNNSQQKLIVGLVKHHRAYPSAFLNKCVKERATNLHIIYEIENVIYKII